MSYTCPFCFTLVDLKNTWFQCSIPSCSQPDELRTRFEQDLQPQQQIPSNVKIIQYHTTFQGNNQHGGVCPKCHRNTTIRVCPSCHSEFPPNIENLSNVIFAVVGARSTGKSHYIAVLINQLKRLYNKFNWSLCALGDETIDLYRRKFYEPLYMQHIRLKQTQGAAADADVKKPLIYSLELYRDNNTKSVVLAFFDSAGEDLTSVQNISKVNRYIAHASGIILLLDPLQISSIRQKVKSNDMPVAEIAHCQNHIIEFLVNFIKSRRRNTESIPLAITFSKIDLLNGLFAEEYGRFETPVQHHKHVINLNEIEGNSDFIKNWLDNEGAECIQAGRRFDSRFFGVSALGKDPKKDNNGNLIIPGGPQPMHVEDPFLWLLYKNDLIQGK
ncbi:MAG: hypothetical protein LBE12_05905 [Planctomycetaceae bacterium]|jgi:hypothetical protein|nr:hypothetical protein [Planctomycetaceae bacterium]